MAIKGELITDATDLERWRADWDGLALQSRLPYSSPAWMLSWWGHVAPPDAGLRVAIVREGSHLIAIAPFYFRKRNGLVDYRLLGTGTSQQREPLLAVPDDASAIKVLVSSIASAQPPPDLLTFEGIPANSLVPAHLQEEWPGRKRPFLERKTFRGRAHREVPAIALEGQTYDRWLASRNRHFRKEMQRIRRRLSDHGAVFRLATSGEEVKRGLRSFADLHYARWRSRGGSAVLNTRVEAMLEEVARQLVTQLRFRLWSIQIEGQIICAEIFVCAGGTVCSWLGGFDEEWSAKQPSIQTLIAALEHSWEFGDDRFELGPGGQDYKYRLADQADILDTTILVPQTLRYPLTRAQLISKDLARIGFRRLPTQHRRHVSKALRRLKTPP
jgi:CelD/BcsL family acetyltransferase involved in cellulose biosynthesis